MLKWSGKIALILRKKDCQCFPLKKAWGLIEKGMYLKQLLGDGIRQVIDKNK